MKKGLYVISAILLASGNVFADQKQIDVKGVVGSVALVSIDRALLGVFEEDPDQRKAKATVTSNVPVKMYVKGDFKIRGRGYNQEHDYKLDITQSGGKKDVGLGAQYDTDIDHDHKMETEFVIDIQRIDPDTCRADEYNGIIEVEVLAK
ncbi:MAG: hypothetical protein LBD66_00165 [Holosporales bacterium]|jgi:hypothetical protein|nr:hypothetical protein [Holosporales bacterium]